MSNAYVINFTDGLSDPGKKESFTIQPYTTNGPLKPTITTLDPLATDQRLPIVLYGKGVPSYGERLQENLVHILENFAGSVAPVNPTKGMLWYYVDPANTASTELRIYNPDIGTDGSGGNEWEAIQCIQTSIPTNPILGEIWFDPDTTTEIELSTVGHQLKTFNGTTWESVGANYVPLSGGTMTGHLDLPTTPGDTQATRKDYVDGLATALGLRIDEFEVGGAKEPVYIDGTKTMTGTLQMGSNKITNLGQATANNDATRLADVVPVNGDSSNAFSGMTGPLTLSPANVVSSHAASRGYVAGLVDTKISKAGDTLDFGANLIFQSGEVIGLPATPSGPTAATSRQYVDTEIAAVGGIVVDSYVDSGTMDLGSSNLTLTVTNGKPAVVIADVAHANHIHLLDRDVIAPITAPSIIYKLDDDDNLTAFHTYFASYDSGGPNAEDKYPYIPLRHVLHYIDTFKAQRDNAFFGGDGVRLDVDTMLNLGREADLSPLASPEVQTQATSKRWVEWKLSPERTIEVAGAAQTIFNSPDFIVGENHLQVYKDGIKQYKDTNATQVIDFNNSISLANTTGLLNNASTYSATVTVDGIGAQSIVVIGSQAQTYEELFKTLNFGVIVDVDSITAGSPGEFNVIGDWTARFPAGTIFDYETIDAYALNSGEYVVAVGGATFAGGITTIPLAVHVYGDPVGTLIAGDPGGTISILNSSEYKVWQQNGNIVIEAASEGATSSISVVDVNLFSSLTGFQSILAPSAGTTQSWHADPATYINPGEIASAIEFNAGLTSGEVVEITTLVTSWRP